METIKEAKKQDCVHFMVWQCLHGHSVYRCNHCDYIDMEKTFADYIKKEEVSQLLTTEIDARLEGLKMEKTEVKTIVQIDGSVCREDVDVEDMAYNRAVSEINERIEKMKGEK